MAPGTILVSFSAVEGPTIISCAPSCRGLRSVLNSGAGAWPLIAKVHPAGAELSSSAKGIFTGKPARTSGSLAGFSFIRHHSKDSIGAFQRVLSSLVGH